jgi:hypothetical protein
MTRLTSSYLPDRPETLLQSAEVAATHFDYLDDWAQLLRLPPVMEMNDEHIEVGRELHVLGTITRFHSAST